MGWERFRDHIEFIEMNSPEKIFFKIINTKEEFQAERIYAKRYLWSDQ